MKRRALALILTLVLVLAMLPAPALAEQGDVGTALPSIIDKASTVTWSATTAGGETITQSTYAGKTQVLIFFQVTQYASGGYCWNSEVTLKGIFERSDLAVNENVQIVAIGVPSGMRGDTTATAEDLQSFQTNCGLEEKSGFTLAWMKNNDKMFSYIHESEVSANQFAVNFVLDAQGHIRAAWGGSYAADYYAGVLDLLGVGGVEGSAQDYQLYTTRVTDPAVFDPSEELALLNEYRASKNLGELSIDGQLQQAAMQRAAETAVYFSHTRPNNTSCFTAIEDSSGGMAENIAAGQTSVEMVMNDWINSDGHRKNIETASFRSVGLGCFTDSNGTKHWVQMFSDRAASGSYTGQSAYDVTVARALLELSAAPSSLRLKEGGVETVTLQNTNQGFNRGGNRLYATSAASTDETVAQVALGDDGAVTVTAVNPGSATVKVGLSAMDSNVAAVTVDVPVTVTAESGSSTTPSPTALTRSMFAVDTTAETYTGSAITKTVTGKDGAKALIRGADYTVTYRNNTNAGTATITITGMGNYTGTLTYTFTIKAKTTKTVEITKYDYVQAHTTNDELPEWTDRQLVGADSNGLIYTMNQEGKYGLFDTVANKELVPCKYEGMGDFSEGLAAVRLNDKLGFIDETGKEVIPCRYDGIGAFSEGLAAVELDGKWGYINKSGTVVIPCQYDSINSFSADGLAAVCVGDWENDEGKYGFIDKTGREVVPCKYDTISAFRSGWSIVGVSTGGKDRYGDPIYQYGVIDTSGKEVVPCQYRYMKYTLAWGVDDDETAITVCVSGDGPRDMSNSKWAILDPKTGSLTPYDYKLAVDVIEARSYPMLGFSEGLAKVQKDSKYGYIDQTGKEIIPCRYDYAAAFSEGLAAIRNGNWETGKWGFIDKAGQEVVPCRYEEVDSFLEGLAAVRLNGKWGYIDKRGELVIPCQYSSVTWFIDGTAYVSQDGESFLIDRTGARVPENDRMELSGGMKLVRRDGRVGVTNAAGKDLIPCIYNAVYSWKDGTALVELNGTVMFVDETGAELETNIPIPTPYDFDGDYLDPSNARYFQENWNWEGGFIYDHSEATSDGRIYSREGICTFTTKVTTAGGGGTTDPAPVAVTGVSVTRTTSVQEGRSKTLTATVKPGNADNKGVYWTSDDTSVVTVDRQTGKLTGVKVGTANVTVTTVDGGFTATCAVTVYTSSIGGGGGGSSSGGGGGGAAGGGGGGGGGATVPSAKPIDPSKPASENFFDVEKSSWYEDGVTYVVRKGLFNGVAQGQFAPQQNMTRAMLMTVLARLDGQDTTGGTTWYSVGMSWAMVYGISDGTMPESSVTREQMVTMLYRYAKAQAGTANLSAFADGSTVSDWAKGAMAWAVANGILTGKDGSRLDPQGTATRAEVATILRRFVEHS